MDFPNAKKQLLELLRTRSFRQGVFTLASGKTSDFFIDCKRVTLSGQGLALVGEVLLEHITYGRETQVDSLAAVPLGGCPLVDATVLCAFRHGLQLHGLYVRTARKDHGTTHKVEGHQNIRDNAKVILLEDVVTSGQSSIQAVDSLRESGVDVLFVLTLIDRLEGGKEALAKKGIKLQSVYTRLDFVPNP